MSWNNNYNFFLFGNISLHFVSIFIEIYEQNTKSSSDVLFMALYEAIIMYSLFVLLKSRAVT